MKPNILFILTDQMRPDTLTTINLPNIRALARRGVSFTHMYSAAPLYQYGTNLGEKWVGLQDCYFDRYGGSVDMGAFMPHTDRPVYRVLYDGIAYGSPAADFDALFDLAADPHCATNLYATHPDLRAACTDRLIARMESLRVPEEHYQRLGLQLRRKQAHDGS